MRASDLLQGEAAEAGAFLDEAWRLVGGTVDPRRAELARLRIAGLLGDRPTPSEAVSAAEVAELSRWPTSGRFDPVDRACLALAEQFVIDVSGVTDAEIGPVLQALGPEGLYRFVQALWLFDMTCRLDMALPAALGEDRPA
jgi:hypothetical protein